MGENNAEQPRLALMAAPANNSANLQRSTVQPRQPHNLQGLLRFAMEATQAEDAPGDSNLGPMDEERRKFLEQALQSMTVDVARVLKESAKVLSDVEKVRAVGSSDDVPVDIEAAIENLLDLVDDLDIANDFYKIGGFAVFPVLLGAQCDAIRASACKILAVVCQNNPFAQARALETGLLNIIFNMAENEVACNVVTMTVYALSCMVREYEPACKEFLAQNGCSILLRLLNFDSIPVRTKAAYLTRYFCKNYSEAQDELLRLDLVAVLSKLLAGERDSSSEHILSTLLTLSENPAALQHIQNPDNKLKVVIEQYVRSAKLDETTDLLEEKEYCEELLNLLKNVRKCEDDVER